MNVGALTTSKPAWIFRRSEVLLLIAVGGLLVLAAIVAFVQAIVMLVPDVIGSTATNGLVAVLDRVLLVLMLVELLHTVGISMDSGELRCQPFLIVGMIAAIRRVLVVTLQASQVTGSGSTPTIPHGAMFQNSNFELLILGFLIAVMVSAIFVLRKAGVS